MASPERRRAPRVRTYRPVRLQFSGTARLLETLTKDLSSGGLRCLSPVSVPVASDLRVELVTFGGEAPLALAGQAVWFRTIPYSDQFELGIAFKELPQDTTSRLSGCLQRLSKGRLTPTSV